jgi:hypothetical protein
MSDDDSIFGDEPEAAPAKVPAATPEPIIELPKDVKIATPASPEAAEGAIPGTAPVAAAPTPSVDIKAKAKILAEKIFKKGHIVDPHIGGMTFRKKLQPKDIGKIKADVPEEIVVLGHKRLVKKSALAEIESVRNKAYSIVEVNSTSSWIPKLRFMTKEASVKVMAELKTLKVDFFKAVDKFVAEYPKLKEEMLAEFPKWAEALAPHYPSPAAVKASFHFEVTQFTASMVTAEGELLSQAQLELEGDLMTKLDDFLKSTVKNTHKLFLDELQSVKEKLDGGDKINAKTIKKIHEMIETATTKDVAGDTDFLAMLDGFKKKFTVDASKEKSFKDEIKDTLDKIITVAGDEKAAEETVVKYKRSILV